MSWKEKKKRSSDGCGGLGIVWIKLGRLYRDRD